MPASLPQLTAALRVRGHRMTPQRRLILDEVSSVSGHIAADAVHRAVAARDPTVNRSTVYRTLDLLERLGFLAHHHAATGIAYHHVGDHEHVHLVCVACEHVTELKDHAIAEEFAVKLRETQGFEANLGHSTIFGVCAGCAAEGHEPDVHHRHGSEEDG